VSLLVWVIDIVYGYYIIGYVVVLFYVLLSYCVLYILYLGIITGLLLNGVGCCGVVRGSWL